VILIYLVKLYKRKFINKIFSLRIVHSIYLSYVIKG
jgi:hypothetical protein